VRPSTKRALTPSLTRLPNFSAAKVPTVTTLFWVLKLLTTALGESISDAAIHRFSPVPTVLVTGAVFAVALAWQFTRTTYQTTAYWSAVLMVGVFGTMVADTFHIAFGLSYSTSMAVFGVALVSVFALWHRVEHDLSIHTITTPRRELFYWATVCATFALGTATGDFTAVTLHWGYLTSALVFSAIITLPGLAWRFVGVSGVAAFWTSYVLTRPLGASYADWTGKGQAVGGLGWGSIHVAPVLATVFIATVALQHGREGRRGQTAP